ncbi:hypothetical protein B296_00001870 [Ensete ventricosum]|uniref:Uncharacterized protein n=1 Tax=Ensete ventricosum TaxID=4639 RepID=A0A427A5P8_ENSVE|nr:hypothetical protein B296_00001870 [Ensete ventricosum]
MQIKASSWLTNQIQHTRILKGLHHFMTTLRSCVPSISVTRTSATTAGKFLRPASESTEVASELLVCLKYTFNYVVIILVLSHCFIFQAPQVVIGHAQHVAHAVVTCRSSVSCWSDMTLNRQAFGTRTSPDEEEAPGSLGTHTRPVNCLQASGCEEILEDQKLLQVNHICKAASVEETSEGEFWLEIEKELHHHHEDMQGLEKEKEESMLLIEAMEKEPPTTPNAQKEHQLYPPGKLLHMVAVPALDHSDTLEDALNNRSIGIYETRRELYGKIRLSQTMIDDHYMPRYKRMIELLIDKLRRDNDGYATAI